MGLVISTQPTSEPVTLDEAKSYLRLIDNNYEDDDISELIKMARQWVELYLRRTLMQTGYTLVMDRFPYLTTLDPMNQANPKFDNANYYYGSPDRFAIWIPRPPLVSVSSVVYYDMANSQQTLSTSSYTVETTGEPGRICPVYGAFWPGTYIKQGAVTITYTAGYSSASLVPSPIKLAIKRLVSAYYNETGQNVIDSLQKSVQDMLYPYRVLDERVLEYA